MSRSRPAIASPPAARAEPAALADVRGEKDREGDPACGPTREVTAPSARRTEQAVQAGALADALEQGDRAPANVNIESRNARHARGKG